MYFLGEADSQPPRDSVRRLRGLGAMLIYAERCRSNSLGFVSDLIPKAVTLMGDVGIPFEI